MKWMYLGLLEKREHVVDPLVDRVGCLAQSNERLGGRLHPASHFISKDHACTRERESQKQSLRE